MERVEGIFKALADGTRLRILNLLLQEDACVCEVGSALGLPQPLVSRHLAYLRNAGLVLDHREGMRVRYSLILKDELGMALERLLRKAFCCSLIYRRIFISGTTRELLGTTSSSREAPGLFNLEEEHHENQSAAL
jgi:DNA-binding transcriptional ArsR family regulator